MTGPRPGPDEVARARNDDGRDLAEEHAVAAEAAAEQEAELPGVIAERRNPSTGRMEYRAYPNGVEHADGGAGAWYAERDQAERVLDLAVDFDAERKLAAEEDAQRVRQADEDAVGRFLDAHESYMAAGHRAARARDAVATLHEDVRRVDRGAEAAAARAAAVDRAVALSGERDAVTARLAEVAAQEPALREKAQGRGYPAQEARTRLATAAADRSACWQRLNEVNSELADVTEKIGTDDPVQWKAMRVDDQGVLDAYRENRAAAIAKSSEHYAAYRDRCAREEAAVVATADQRAAAEAELEARGIDPQQVMETAERAAAERRTRELVQPTERYVYEQRAAELDAERDRGRD